MNKLTIQFSILLLAILLLAPKDGAFTPALAAQTATLTSQEVNFPELTGPYKVGLTSFEWVDQSRDETLASIPGLKRDLMVYIWFPAALAKHTKLAPYMQDDLMWNIWSGHTGQDSMVHSHAYSTTLLDPDKPSYPVLIFSPCLYCISLNYASIMEEIASHGYIVIGTSHPYSTAVINYPDGRVLVGRNLSEAPAMQARWTQDVRFVLDQVENLNAKDKDFKGHLDLAHVGVLGHFFAGPIAANVTALDPRIKAGVTLSGIGSSTDVGSTPFLYFGLPYHSQQTHDKYVVHIDGTSYFNYDDFGLLLPLIPEIEELEGLSLGSIDPARGIQIVNSYLLAFFDHYLKGSDLKWPVYDEAKLIAAQ